MRRIPQAELRVGLIGYGTGGRYFHAPFIEATPGCKLAGVVTRSASRRAAIQSNHPGAKVFDSVRDLVDSGVDAVTVCTPVKTHSSLTNDLIERRIPVLCDKPFALNASDARETVTLAEGLQVPLTVYQNRRWDSDFLTIRKLADLGEIGEIRRLESSYERWAERSSPPEAGGGLLLDFGSHLVDQALNLNGQVQHVYAEVYENSTTMGDDFIMLLAHRSGRRSVLRGAWRQGSPAPRFRVTGTIASFVSPGPMDGQEQSLFDGKSPSTEGDEWGREPTWAWGAVGGGSVRTTVPSERGRWDLFYPLFMEAVRGKGPVPVDPWDAVATAEVIDAARVSARESRVVAMPGPNV